jgi:hypothetical protein
VLFITTKAKLINCVNNNNMTNEFVGHSFF